jgi:hypothetical protein
MRSTRSSNDGARVPDPSILTPPAGRSRDLQGTTKLECTIRAVPHYYAIGCRRESRTKITRRTGPNTTPANMPDAQRLNGS